MTCFRRLRADAAFEVIVTSTSSSLITFISSPGSSPSFTGGTSISSRYCFQMRRSPVSGSMMARNDTNSSSAVGFSCFHHVL